MSMEKLLNDAMGPRRLAARWVIRGTLRLETAMHLGGESVSGADMPIVRDGLGGAPLLPGTTLAGALRNALADRLAGYEEAEPPEVAALFGGARGDDDGAQSPLIVFDALGVLQEGQDVELRDGVAIDPHSGTAEDHKKYDYEVLPAGTTFPVRVDLLVPDPPVAGPDADEPTADASAHLRREGKLISWLAAALDTLSHGESGFGARRSRGLGRIRASWSAHRFDLRTRPGWLSWALSDHEQPYNAPSPGSSIHEAIESAAPPGVGPLSPVGDKRTEVTIALDLKVTGELLVRSAGAAADAPDAVHLHSGGVPVLPVTSLAGVLRQQALRIACLVRGVGGELEVEAPEGKPQAELAQDGPRWVDRLFGPRFQDQRPDPDFAVRASRIRVGEAALRGSTAQHHTRVAIDRFTSGAADTALFEEQTAEGGTLQVELALRNPQPGELGLVLLVVRDLLEGQVAVGGTSSVGRGFLQGKATVTWRDGGEDDRKGKAQRRVVLCAGEPPGDTVIDEAIAEFVNASPLSETQHEGLAAHESETSHERDR